MSDLDKDILKDFVNESKRLIQDLVELLEAIEGDFSQVTQLEEFGQKVDRIMGAAQSLALLVPPEHALHKVADCAALCKAVGYKAAHIKGNPQLYDVCVALLLDATEVLRKGLENIENETSEDLKTPFSATFVDRLRWVSQQLNAPELAVQKNNKKMDQNEIDELIRKLGFG